MSSKTVLIIGFIVYLLYRTFPKLFGMYTKVQRYRKYNKRSSYPKKVNSTSRYFQYRNNQYVDTETGEIIDTYKNQGSYLKNYQNKNF